jgi:hypothetical protein
MQKLLNKQLCYGSFVAFAWYATLCSGLQDFQQSDVERNAPPMKLGGLMSLVDTVLDDL